jgi:hypothetical protein
LQDELDEANRKIRMLEHGDSTLLISAADNAKDIHRVLKESLLGSKFAKLAGLMLGGERTTAAKLRFKRGKLKRAPPGEEHWDNPVQAEPKPKKRVTPPWAKTGKLWVAPPCWWMRSRQQGGKGCTNTTTSSLWSCPRRRVIAASTSS